MERNKSYKSVLTMIYRKIFSSVLYTNWISNVLTTESHLFWWLDSSVSIACSIYNLTINLGIG